MRRACQSPTRPLRLATATAATAAAAAAAVAAAARRVEVRGDSMRPGLAPGDRLVALRWRWARPGHLVVVRDPRDPARLLVKRVVSVVPGGVTVAGDNPGASTDSRTFGPVGAVWGRPVYRYHPLARAGRLRR